LFTRNSEIIFIGAGKVAHTLIPLFIEKNYSVGGVISKNIKSASTIAKQNHINFYSNKFQDISDSFRIFIITVPDNEIIRVAKQLTSLKLNFESTLFVHTSGSESSEALRAVERKGGTTASFHIMQTFNSLQKTNIKNCFAAIETDYPQVQKFLFSVSKSFGLNAFTLNKEDKVYYHLTGVFISNFLNANFFSAEELMNKIRLNNNNRLRIFEPIITSTLSNIRDSGSGGSLTGPVQRGDFITIKKHISALKKIKSPNKKLLLYSYISQSLILLEVVKKQQKKLSSGQKELKMILEGELKNPHR
jgi:predicted short-subunit dehydrogenase-like oxidoreductase (DUF2520 family)